MTGPRRRRPRSRRPASTYACPASRYQRRRADAKSASSGPMANAPVIARLGRFHLMAVLRAAEVVLSTDPVDLSTIPISRDARRRDRFRTRYQRRLRRCCWRCSGFRTFAPNSTGPASGAVISTATRRRSIPSAGRMTSDALLALAAQIESARTLGPSAPPCHDTESPACFSRFARPQTRR